MAYCLVRDEQMAWKLCLPHRYECIDLRRCCLLRRIGSARNSKCPDDQSRHDESIEYVALRIASGFSPTEYQNDARRAGLGQVHRQKVKVQVDPVFEVQPVERG